MKKITIRLNDRYHTFLNSTTGSNHSVYINELLNKERMKSFREALLAANIEEAENTDYQKLLSDWNTTIQDGLPKD